MLPILNKRLLTLLLYLGFIVSNFAYYHDSYGVDLSSSYIGCQVLATDQAEHLYSYDNVHFNKVGDPVWKNIAQEKGYVYNYPPYVQTPLWAYALQPLCSVMDFQTFNLIFLLIELISIVFIIWLVADLWAPRFKQPLYLAIALFLVAISIPFRYTLFLNQTHPIFIALVMAAVYLLKNSRIALSGLALAFAAAVKLTPGLIAIYWLTTGRYRAFASFAAWSIGLIALTLLAVGPTLILEYIDTLKRISSILLVAFNNQSLATWLADLSGHYRHIIDWTASLLPDYAKWLSNSAILVSAALLAWLHHKLVLANPTNKEPFEALAVSILLLTFTLFSSIAWTHYYIILIVPLMVLSHIAHQEQRHLLLLPIGIILALNLQPLAMNAVHPGMDTLTILRSHFFSGLIALITLYNEIRILNKKNNKPSNLGTQ